MMAEPTSIIVSQIPSKLPIENQEELLKFFGAKSVRCVTKNGKSTGVAFATFSSHEEAKHALFKLHQLHILNHYLVVEYAREEHQSQLPKESDFPIFKLKQLECPKSVNISDKEQLKQGAEDFNRKLHGICPAVGLDYLPSSLLKYNYPPPNATIIANISHALVAVPKFYNQVLHLMNKMNLPAPFGPLTRAPPLSANDFISENDLIDDYFNSDVYEVEEMDTGTEDESEIESDSENARTHLSVPVRPVQSTRRKRRRKEPNYQHFIPVQPSTLKTSSHAEPSDIFESQAMVESQKKIHFNIKPNFETMAADVPLETQPVSSAQTGFGTIEAPKQDKSTDNNANSFNDDSVASSKFITLDELKQKRISSSEMKTLSAFRNYSPGEPTVRLYIKNLARQVQPKDLKYIFGRFIDWDSDNDKNMFDIRLMTEGRMKGQAFVTLANEKQAIEAVEETNGYVLHTKPLVVQFARSARPKDAPTKSEEKQS